MLKYPYAKYSRIYTYHLDGVGVPSIDDPDLIGAWIEDGRTILVFHRPKEELVEKICRQSASRIFYQADLDYKDWEMGFEPAPFSVGPLQVAPVWDTGTADIRIDPSVVFGTGFHPSTRLCLEGLVKYHKDLNPDFTGLDLGCGTGLLSIGAARLGAAAMLAVDYNSLACEVTKQNVLRNTADDIVRVKQLDLRQEIPDTNVDVIVANLHADLLAVLFQTPMFWQAKLYIFSGFMTHEEKKLLAVLPDKPPTFLDRGAMDKWRLWVMGNITGK